MRGLSIIEQESTSRGNIPLFIDTIETSHSPIKEVDGQYEGLGKDTYLESKIDPHDYEFPFLHSCSTYIIDIDYGNLPPFYDVITYEDIEMDPKLVKYASNNHICMMSEAPHYDEDKDLCLMYAHLIDWG